jgi:crotonobetainyl-CoA:carnitine CoA-transferase CaiB-like acyl-CoA transferase
MMLEGVRIVEHATYFAGPGAGGILADWGADVIKIEPPAGDPARTYFPTRGTPHEHLTEDAGFDSDNRGKRSIVIDTGKAEGPGLIRRLAAGADVFLTNVRPAGLARAGLDPDTLAAINPKLVYAQVTGYGVEGPDAHRPGFDIAAFWARTGLARLTPPKGVDLFPLRTAVGDHTTSLAAVAGICAALLEAQRTGRGRRLDISLLRAGLYTVSTDFANQLVFGRTASTRPRQEPYVPLLNFFRTSDDRWICLVPRAGDIDLPRIARALGRPEMLEDARFRTVKSRRENAAFVTAMLDTAFADLSFEEAARRLDAEELAWSPAQTLTEAASDPQVRAAGAVARMRNRAGDASFETPGGPIGFGEDRTASLPASPAIGEHTRAILAELGCTAEEIKGYYASGVVR